MLIKSSHDRILAFVSLWDAAVGFIRACLKTDCHKKIFDSVHLEVFRWVSTKIIGLASFPGMLGSVRGLFLFSVLFT